METFQDKMKKLTLEERRSYVRDHPELDAEQLRSLLLACDEVRYIAMQHKIREDFFVYLLEIPESLYHRREEEIKKVVDVMKEFFSNVQGVHVYGIVRFSEDVKYMLYSLVYYLKTVTMTDVMLDHLDMVTGELKANPERSWEDSYDLLACKKEQDCRYYRQHGTILGDIYPHTFCRGMLHTLLTGTENRYIVMMHLVCDEKSVFYIRIPNDIYHRRREEIEEVVTDMQPYMDYERDITIATLSDSAIDLMNCYSEIDFTMMKKTTTLTDRMLDGMIMKMEEVGEDDDQEVGIIWRCACDDEDCMDFGHTTLLASVYSVTFCKHREKAWKRLKNRKKNEEP